MYRAAKAASFFYIYLAVRSTFAIINNATVLSLLSSVAAVSVVDQSGFAVPGLSVN